jgi:ribosomal protein S18 acetylase RimI-like enzyme
LGEKLYRAFERWTQTRGAKEIRLLVAKQNEAASRFWLRLGFQEMERRSQSFGAKESVFILMNHILPPDSSSF